MPPITKAKTREIVEDFAQEIRDRRAQTVKPSMAVINFRTDIKDGIEREVLVGSHRDSALPKRKWANRVGRDRPRTQYRDLG